MAARGATETEVVDAIRPGDAPAVTVENLLAITS